MKAPNINIEYSTIEINLRPWKWKVSNVIYIIDLCEPLADEFDRIIKNMQDDGKWKRRTVIGYTVTNSVTKKL